MLIPKLGEDFIRRENYEQISLMNIGETFVNKPLVSQIQQDIKNGFIIGIQV